MHGGRGTEIAQQTVMVGIPQTAFNVDRYAGLSGLYIESYTVEFSGWSW